MTNGAGEQQGLPTGDDFGLSALREVLELIKNSDISELKIERGGAKLHIRRGAPPAQSSQPFFVTPSLATALPQAMHSPLPPVAPFHRVGGAAPPADGEEAATPEEHEELPKGQPIAAPMVGTFYSAPSPKDTPYVQEGDVIQVGERVGIIEAMKMMNEIESEIAGRIARILVKNGQAVEYGQPLMIVEPA
jgi:acetyl-CoA carboxylase biotin carboxyl carrier protein